MSTMKPSCSSLRRFVVTLLWAGLAAVLFAGCQKEEKAAGPPAPPSVEVVELNQKDVPIFSEWVGTMDGSVNATIRPQVQGYLIQQNYKEGDLVKKGQLLFEIDPRPRPPSTRPWPPSSGPRRRWP